MNNSIAINDRWENVTHKYPDKYFDIAVVDPPYGINVANMPFTRENKVSVKQKNGSKITIKKENYIQSDWDLQTPSQDFFDEICRISKCQIIFGIDYFDWKGVGFGRIIWDKCVPDGVSFKRYETAYCSQIDQHIIMKYLWSGMMQGKSMSEPTIQQGNKKLNEKRIHPCQKPIILYNMIFRDFGFNGMKVIDTHMGSGSSRISAEMNGCSEYVGIESDKIIFDKHIKRYNQYKSKLLLDFG